MVNCFWFIVHQIVPVLAGTIPESNVFQVSNGLQIKRVTYFSTFTMKFRFVGYVNLRQLSNRGAC